MTKVDGYSRYSRNSTLRGIYTDRATGQKQGRRSGRFTYDAIIMNNLAADTCWQFSALTEAPNRPDRSPEPS